ncbi:DUF4200 domain-containing protein [Haematococcus lacustris]|uniref:DUF4200 domain-containing protein n=1 Tax=Haematococcus lacustris TaxID=44745 RepID=A0A699ZP48_HAELA|nr:DUF4200 domain-containing protein [Haematococcus lacustris]
MLQMSLDTKRAEIKKLEERARQREEALKKSEQMLEEDALRFDAFLKENDEKVQEAIKRAEVEAKAKQDKVLEIKRLTTAIAALRSEMNKYEEQLEDCRKYREFLDGITPPEFFEAQANKLQQRKDALVAEWQASCEAIRKRKDAALAAKSRAEHDISPDDQEMYFREPGQLLSVYQALEESNLFYIQNAQETEEALEELRTKYRDTKQRLDGEVASLNGQVASLRGAIDAAQGKARRLKERTIEDVGSLTLAMGGAAGGPAISLDQLTTKVAEVYVRCGFDADKSVGTLQMLTNIESKLEEYLGIVDGMSPEFVESSEKSREKERRRRASAPVFKKQGKPTMFRSQPPKKKVEEKKDERADEEAELEAYLARDMV